MNQKHYLILGIIVVVVVIVAILVTKYTTTEISVLTQNPVVINTETLGAPSSPMDLVLSATQFSDDKTSEITVRVGKRTGYKTDWFQANNTKVEIQLPEGLELIEGNSIWAGDIIGEEVTEFKVKVKAVKNGEWIVKANAITKEFPGYESVGDTERFYILVKDDEVLISDRSFTPVSPVGKAEQIKEEHEECPQGYEWNAYRKECVSIEHETCPEAYIWNSNLQKCVLIEHEECPEAYVWDEMSQSCQRGEEPVNP